jgi:sterol desaturase/sphingolipid hydroxylase (fatty acid hydroxylase superfamily)
MSSLIGSARPDLVPRVPSLAGIDVPEPVRTHRRSVYAPAFVIVAAAVCLIGVGWSSHWWGDSFAASMRPQWVVALGPATLGILGCILVVERLRPAQRRSRFARGYRQDALYALIGATLVVPLVVALSLSFTEIVQRDLPWIVLPRIEVLPRWLVIAAVFVAMDGCNWLVHLANHRVRVLWRFHELHHSQEDMSVLTVFRTHPLIHVSYLVALVPGLILLANGTVTTTLLVAYAGFVAFEHSNTNLGFGPLGRILVSPNYHRIHHQLDGPQDVNLGFALTIWDQLFHRAVFPTEATVRMDTGLPGRPLAVEQSGHHLRVLAAQLWGPFRPLGQRRDSFTAQMSRRPCRPIGSDPAGAR